MPSQFATPKEIAEISGIPYLQVLRWIKSRKLVMLRDSQRRTLINIDRFMSSLRPDLDIGYTCRGGRGGRRDPVEPLELDLEDGSDGDPASESGPKERSANGRSQPRRAVSRTPKGSASAPASAGGRS